MQREKVSDRAPPQFALNQLSATVPPTHRAKIKIRWKHDSQCYVSICVSL